LRLNDLRTKYQNLARENVGISIGAA
jgi:hypothetical protein